MIIKQAGRRDRYLVMDKSALEDPSLSWKAKGILCYLLSCPPSWVVRAQDLLTRAIDGKGAVRSGLRELREAGYAKLVHTQDPTTKKFTGRELWIYEHKQAERRVSGKSRNPSFLKPATIKKERKRRKDLGSLGANRADSSFALDGDHQQETVASYLCTQFREFAIRHRYHVGTKRPNLRRWREECDALIQSLDGDHQKVEKVMRWYFENHRDPYVGTYKAMTSFCENFYKLEKAMHRQQKTRPEDSDEPTIRYTEMKRTKKKARKA